MREKGRISMYTSIFISDPIVDFPSFLRKLGAVPCFVAVFMPSRTLSCSYLSLVFHSFLVSVELFLSWVISQLQSSCCEVAEQGDPRMHWTVGQEFYVLGAADLSVSVPLTYYRKILGSVLGARAWTLTDFVPFHNSGHPKGLEHRLREAVTG